MMEQYRSNGRSTVTQLSSNAILIRAPEVALRFLSNSQVAVSVDQNEERRVVCSRHAPAILEAFEQPTTLHAAVAALQQRARGRQDWIDLTADIYALYSIGALLDRTEMPERLPASYTFFDQPGIHIAMLNDRLRTDAYLTALREVVRPEDVVVEIGTGTGVLAIGAALSGAKHVYAVEAGRIADVAEANIRANGVEEQVTLVRGWSSGVTLPELGSILVSEMIGAEPFDEDLIKFTVDALQRLVKPDARLVPHRLRLFALPVELPDEKRGRYFALPEHVEQWRAWYGIDLGALAHFTPEQPFLQHFSVGATDWRVLSDPILLADLDLRALSSLSLDVSARGVASAEGRIDGVSTYLEIGLGSGVLDLHPLRLTTSHWRNSVWLLSQPRCVRAGDRLDVGYQFKTREARTRLTFTIAE
jgi:hypothetical protein